MDAPRYMLDTNTASYVIKNQLSTREKLQALPLSSICISAITEAELKHGVANMPGSKRLPLVVSEFLLRVESLPWDSKAASSYADLKVHARENGISLSKMDMLIAAHACSQDAILVTNDQAFFNFKSMISIENWVTLN